MSNSTRQEIYYIKRCTNLEMTTHEINKRSLIIKYTHTHKIIK